MPPEGSEPDLEQLFHRARALSGSERERFLERQSTAGSALLERLRAMLAADEEETGTLFEHGARAPAAGSEVRVGRYKLLRVLGEGGMGTVHLAEQEEPVRRLVALKSVRVGRNTTDVLARFQAERQALALMEHPGIAQIFDGGVSESGLPYFVMEYVPGRTLDDHCDHEGLGLAERLRLFVKICEAVQHAHQKGVIHRDLKSNNVLVLVQEGVAQPKVIDFGVARALAGSLAGEPLAEARVRVVGTHLFMSPEQARGEDVDTRSDVFALGVMLYRLITGVWPFDRESLAELSHEEYLRHVLEEAPPAPSARVAALGPEAEALARSRGTNPRALVRALRGDLDWIAARALAPVRLARYPTASELGADVERHLAHEPVAAAPAGGAYRMHRFVRRHRFGVSLLSALALVLVGATISISVLLAREIRAEARATYQAERARGIADFVELAIEDRTLAARREAEPTVRELFDDPLADLGQRHAEKPLVEAGVLTALGRMLLDLGSDALALQLLLRAEILQKGGKELDPYDRFETLDALITAARRVDGPQAARPYVAPALAAARQVLADLDAREERALTALLDYQAGSDVPGSELVSGLEVLLSGLPHTLAGRDPRVHSTARVAVEVGISMIESGSPEVAQYLARLEDRARALLGPQSYVYAHFLWSLTRQLAAAKGVAPELAREHAQRLVQACALLPADQWLRRESERLLAQCSPAGEDAER